MSFETLKKELGEGKLRSLYLFYGQEDYLLKKYSTILEERVLDKSFKELNLNVFEGRMEEQKIIDASLTAPFMANKRLIILKDSGFFKPLKKEEEESKSKKKKKTTAGLNEFLGKLPGHVCIVFCEKEVDKRIKLLETVKREGLIVEFQYQKPADLAKWVTIELKNAGISISPADASFLIEYSEPGMHDIAGQIEKLKLYALDKKVVERSDIESLCQKSIKSIIFDLTDAISEKNAKKSLQFLRDMIELKEPIPRIIYMMTKQFRDLLSAKVLLSSGVDKKELAGKLGVHPFSAEKLSRQERNFSMEELKRAIQLSYHLDLDVKNSRISDAMSAELLVIKFCSVEGRK